MSIVVVHGAQWGDEGKGKLVDVLAAKASLVVRYHGGHNAGHTLVIDGKKIKLSLIPCGVCHADARCLLAAGMVIEPDTFVNEKNMLDELGFDVGPEKIMIDRRAHIVMPYHRALDQARETFRGEAKIGTTGRGIGPCYEDRAARLGFQVGELANLSKLTERLSVALHEKKALLASYAKEASNGEAETFSVDTMQAFLERAAARLLPHVTDGAAVIEHVKKQDDLIIFEGAQAFLLDTIFGTYPYVTASQTVASSIFSASGIALNNTVITLGVAKAYATRVGSGPFPSEASEQIAEQLREKGGEYGTVTGRPRRCGWLDIDLLRDAIQINGYQSLAITKLDVLSGFSEIQILHNGNWQTVPGWSEDISTCVSVAELPQTAKQYLGLIERLTGTPISVVGVGPDRKQLLTVESTKDSSPEHAALRLLF